MSFPRYPTYQKSEAGWMSDVPEHWKLLPCRGFVDERTEKNEDASCQSYLSLMANVGVIPYEEKGDIGNKKPDDLSKCKIVHHGDFVINSMNYGIGSYGVSAYAGVCSPVYIILRPKSDVVEPGFAFRVFEDKSFQAYAQSFGNGILAHRCSIGWDDLKGIAVGIPPAEEQKSILTFLDRETAKIDALIAEQERLIELLQEKRQVVISNAVTKGLNPDTPMKDSGVEWLGEVPEHWEVKALKRLSPKQTVGIVVNPSSYISDEGLPFIYGGDIREEAIDLENCRKISKEDSLSQPKTILEGEDLITVRVGAPGVTAVVPEAAVGGNCASVMLTKKGDFDSRWLCYLMNSRPYRHQVEVVQYGAAQEQFNISHAVEFICPTPPIAEQKEIADYLLEECQAIDQLGEQVKMSIVLMQERRSALISAAVTGQIDVRDLVSEQEVAA